LNHLTFAATAAAIAACLLAAPGHADELQANTLAPGYSARSINLGVPFGGAIAIHPAKPRILYVTYGNYSDHRVLRLDLDTGTTATVTPVVGNAGGLAVLANGDLAIADNFDQTSDTLLGAHDANGDGDFLDAGEITELITPILDGGNFTGAQMAITPEQNRAGLPAGTLLVQTADGGSDSEILAIASPDTAPAFRPAGGAFYSGFTYNGGLTFSPAGDVLCGISEFPTGRVMALVNANGNETIEPGEAHEIIGAGVLTNSIADLAATADGKVLTSENSGAIRMFTLPADLTSGQQATPGVLAETNGTYISAVRADNPAAQFSPGAKRRATLYIGGYVTFPAATNLLAITPDGPTAAEDWQLFQ